MNYVIATFLLVSCMNTRNHLLYFVRFCAGSAPKTSEQKPVTKNFARFHNHFPLLTMNRQSGVAIRESCFVLFGTHQRGVANLNNASLKTSANKLQQSLVDPMLAALLFAVPGLAVSSCKNLALQAVNVCIYTLFVNFKSTFRYPPQSWLTITHSRLTV